MRRILANCLRHPVRIAGVASLVSNIPIDSETSPGMQFLNWNGDVSQHRHKAGNARSLYRASCSMSEHGTSVFISFLRPTLIALRFMGNVRLTFTLPEKNYQLNRN